MEEKKKWRPAGFKRVNSPLGAFQDPEYFNAVWDVAYDALGLLEECKPPMCFHPDVKAKIDAFLAQHRPKEFVVKTLQSQIEQIVGTPSCHPDVQKVGRVLADAIDDLRREMERGRRST